MFWYKCISDIFVSSVKHKPYTLSVGVDVGVDQSTFQCSNQGYKTTTYFLTGIW